MDGSGVGDGCSALMIHVIYKGRALPLAWRVATTEGAIGFATQKVLLEAVAPWIPARAPVRLMGGDYAAAESEAHKALKLDPRSADAQTVLAATATRFRHQPLPKIIATLESSGSTFRITDSPALNGAEG